MGDPLFDGLSPSQRRIVVTYEYLRFQHADGGDTLNRRIAKELGYKLNPKTNHSAFVAFVIRQHKERKKKEEQRKKGEF